MKLFTVTIAHTGDQLEIHAPTWQDALRRTGRPDACLVEQTGERSFEVTFDPDTPQLIDYRLRYGSPDDALRAVLDHVVHWLDAADRGREGMA